MVTMTAFFYEKVKEIRMSKIARLLRKQFNEEEKRK